MHKISCMQARMHTCTQRQSYWPNCPPVSIHTSIYLNNLTEIWTKAHQKMDFMHICICADLCPCEQMAWSCPLDSADIYIYPIPPKLPELLGFKFCCGLTKEEPMIICIRSFDNQYFWAWMYLFGFGYQLFKVIWVSNITQTNPCIQTILMLLFFCWFHWV